MDRISYTFNTNNPQQQYVDILVEFIAVETLHFIQLPAWRPGRYELGDFAKNVRDFKVANASAVNIQTNKITKDCWEVQTQIGEKYTVSYSYYAAELNAGSTYFNDEQLYVNPVNCCVYIKGLESLSCEVKLNVPDNYQVACSLRKISDFVLESSSFDELADSPWIASDSLLYNTYTVEDTIFHLWFQGECQPDFERLKSDFSRFSQEQFNRYGEFPFDEYHFLFQIVPFQAHHGVEHLKSTVIYLGSSSDIFNYKYTDLLGVSSHELYHCWNVKSIRPIEMFPYDFTKENYSKLGYLSEGVTTYMGDLMLLRSGVFSIQDFVTEMNIHLQKHFHNPARNHTSVADSSFDTWLDGYVSGAPERKVSIYTEGALLSLAMDILILFHTDGKYRLDDVMKDLYNDFAKQGRGVAENDFWCGIQKYIGKKEDEVWSDYYHGNADFEPLLQRVFEIIGVELSKDVSKFDIKARIGFKTIQGNTGEVISSIYPNSLADKSGLMLNDEIIAVNDIVSNRNVSDWLFYFKNKTSVVTVIRNGKLKNIELAKNIGNTTSYLDYKMSLLQNPTAIQKRYFNIWSKS